LEENMTMQERAQRRDAPIICQTYSRRVEHRARHQRFCSRRCRQKADYVEKSLAAPKPNARNARPHSKKQIRQIANIGFLVPILIDQGHVVIAGNPRYGAAKLLEVKEVPTIEVQGLAEGKRRGLALADNEIAENAGWYRELLAIELFELAEILLVEGLDIFIPGFVPVEIDQIATEFEEEPSDPANLMDPEWARAALVTKPDDLSPLGNHPILCGDARGADDLRREYKNHTGRLPRSQKQAASRLLQTMDVACALLRTGART
jgi:hypothetical protein